jgi:hypothetical protein
MKLVCRGGTGLMGCLKAIAFARWPVIGATFDRTILV